MKKHVPAKTIIQQIQPQCDTLHIKMKHQKDARHETNQSVADKTGIPISNIAKFFSGTLSSPSVYYMAAISICLGLSLDELLGITPETDDAGDKARIAELEAQLETKNRELELVTHHSKYLEAGIKERKPVIYSLAGLCLFLAASLMVYLVVDIGNKNFGFFRADGVSPFGVAVVIFMILAVAFLVSRFLKKKDTEKG